MKIIRTFILLLCCSPSLYAQNLVPNPSFEEVNICTEYIAPCAPSGWVAVAPEMIKMKYLCNGQAMQGQHHVSIQQEGPVDNPDSRVYIQTRLLCPLQKGKAYKVSVYMNTDNYVLRLGVRFDTSFIFTEKTGCLPVPASMELQETDQQKKLWHSTRMPWYIMEKTYVATDNSTHLILGNFRAPVQRFNGIGYFNAQVLIDSISITPVEPQPICADTAAVRAALYAEHHRHSIPESLIPERSVVHRLNGSSEGCDTLILKDDMFDQDRTTISERYRQQINDALQHYKGDTTMRIQLVGHAWQFGSDEFNRIVSYDKAKAVATYLVYNEGYSFDDFQIRGEGKHFPRSEINTAENNRVEMIFCHTKVVPPVLHKVIPPPDTLVIPDILFKFNSSELNAALYASLDSLMKKIPRDGSVQLQVTGHTDNAGKADYNYNLSLRRANAVAAYMQKYGVGDEIRQITGAGESQPIADNKTVEGRRKNRRVEIIIFHTTD